MKKVLAIVLALVIALSMSTVAFAEEDVALVGASEETTAATFDIMAIVEQIVGMFNGETDILTQIQDIINQIVNMIENFTSFTNEGVQGAIDDLEAKLGGFTIGGDLIEKAKELINNLKQKIKDLYAGEVATEVEETEAEVPAETGSSTVGLAAFAAVSVACAAAYVCTKKRA